jgi:starvation-inducible DNA-binding protein
VNKVRSLEARHKAPAPLDTPTDLSPNAVGDLSAALNAILADTYALYLKTKNFHWHVSGPHFRDYHLLLDEQSEDILKTTDDKHEDVATASLLEVFIDSAERRTWFLFEASRAAERTGH